MNIFASAARGKFLTQALIAAGLTEDAIASAQAAGTADFLGKLGDEQAAAASKAVADLAAANTRLAELEGHIKAASKALNADAFSVEAVLAAVESREAAARKAGEEAATLRAAQELAARGHAPVATAPAAAASSEPAKPGEGLTGLAKVTAIFRAEQAAARQN